MSIKNSNGLAYFGFFSFTGTLPFFIAGSKYTNILCFATLFSLSIDFLKSSVGIQPLIRKLEDVAANFNGASAFSSCSLKNSSAATKKPLYSSFSLLSSFLASSLFLLSILISSSIFCKLSAASPLYPAIFENDTGKKPNLKKKDEEITILNKNKEEARKEL